MSASQFKPVRPLSQGPGAAAKRLPGAFFGLFFLVGCAVFYFTTVRPAARIVEARSWTPTECTVLSSRVKHHRGKSTTYSVEIHYAYKVNGHEYHSSRYSFLGGSSSGHKGKAAIVRRHPAGKRATCFVNPRHPAEAVLVRGFTPGMWIGLVPLAFMAAGLGGLIAARRQTRRLAQEAAATFAGTAVSLKPAATGAATATADAGAEAGSRVLKPAMSRHLGFVALLVFTAFWNGVIFFGMFGGGKRFRLDRFDWFDGFALLFSVPFVLIGLGMMALTVYTFLGLFNPRPELTLTPGEPALGGAFDLAWRLHGRTHALRDLQLFLEGREEATYARGTSTCTDKKTFRRIDLAGFTSPADMRSGHCRVTLPADAVPSFKSAHNRIVWSLCVQGSIPRWPDLKDEFEIQVRPPRGPAASAAAA
jgi:hypothetical protein